MNASIWRDAVAHSETLPSMQQEEFYQCYDGDLTLSELQPARRGWETVYSTVRPHQALPTPTRSLG